MKIAVLQTTIPHYRKPLFEALGQLADLTLVLAEAPLGDTGAPYATRVVIPRRIGPLRFTPGLKAVWEESDVVVVPLDVRWTGRLQRVLRDRRTPVVWWGLGFGNRSAARWLQRRILRFGDAVVLYGDQARASFERVGVPSEAVFVAPNAVDVPNAGFNSFAVRDQFVFVGTLKPRKGVDDAIRGFARADLDSGIRFTVIGNGTKEQRGALRQLAEREGVGNRVVLRPGTTDPAQLQEVFQRSLAFVSPGSVGLGVLHSFAYGVPVVTQRPAPEDPAPHGPEVYNVVDGVTGMFTDGTILGLSRALQTLAQDPELSLRLGGAGYEHYRNHRTVEGMASRMLSACRFAMRKSEGESLEGVD